MDNYAYIRGEQLGVFFNLPTLSIQCLYLLIKTVLNHAERLGEEQETQMLSSLQEV